MKAFDVLREPWIPVVRPDGTRAELGIIPCLEDSPELCEIRDAAPIIEFGLYRLLVAFVLDALAFAGRRPEDPDDLRLLVEEGSFDSGVLHSYVDMCGDVFDLFHDKRPFLQSKMEEKKPKPLAGIFPVAPSGTNTIHWHHKAEGEFVASAEEAARLLATIAPFMTAGGAGLSPSINGAPAVYALPLGRSLFETVALNIPVRGDQDTGTGEVAWRSRRPPGEERTQATTVEALTWRPRRLQLIPEEAGDGKVCVRKMKFERGDSTRLNWIDSSLAYRYDKDKTTPIRMRYNRPLWRDAGPLLLLSGGEHGSGNRKISFRRPDVVEHAFAVSDASDSMVIQVYGMRTDLKMKVFEWARAALTVPQTLGRSTRLGMLVQGELDRAEQAAYHLHRSIKALYPREGAGNKNALGTAADRSERLYWQLLETEFHPLMSTFARLEPDAADDPELIQQTASDWRGGIRRFALEQFESVAKDMDTDSDALERQVRARMWLNKVIRKVTS